MTFIPVAKTSDVNDGEMKTVTAEGKRIALANVDGEFFAIDDTCSHEECSFGAEGMLDGNIAICGCHGSTFDVTNGKVLSLPAPTDVASYKVKVEGDTILVEL